MFLVVSRLAGGLFSMEMASSSLRERAAKPVIVSGSAVQWLL